MKGCLFCCACVFLARRAGQLRPWATDPASDLFKERPEVEGEKITIQQAITMALKDSYSVVNATKNLQIYEQQMKEANASFYPTVSITGSYDRALKKGRIAMNDQLIEMGQNNTFTASAGLDYVLWSGGQIRNNAKLAKVNAESGLYSLKKRKIWWCSRWLNSAMTYLRLRADPRAGRIFGYCQTAFG